MTNYLITTTFLITCFNVGMIIYEYIKKNKKVETELELFDLSKIKLGNNLFIVGAY